MVAYITSKWIRAIQLSIYGISIFTISLQLIKLQF